MQVTVALGYKYLWIDSLCIIQSGDDQKDWKEQSMLMGRVYQNAQCNIVASSSKNGKGGCFQKRDAAAMAYTTTSLKMANQLPRISKLSKKGLASSLLKKQS